MNTGWVLQRVDFDQYEASVDLDEALTINWVDDIDDAHVWYNLNLAKNQASDYAALGFKTKIVEVEVEK